MKKIAWALTGAACLMFASCTKKSGSNYNTTPALTGGNSSSAPPTAPAATQSINSLFAALVPPSQTQCITAGVDDTITFMQGTRVVLYPDSFVDPFGAPITTGTICIEAKEVYRLGDQITNRSTGQAYDDQLLTNRGQIWMRAKWSSIEVYARKIGVGFAQPAVSNQPMDIYYGVVTTADSIVKWNRSNLIGPGTTVPGTVTAAPFLGYALDSAASFGWLSASRLETVPGLRTTIHVNLPDVTYSDKNTEVYVLIPSLKATIPISEYNKTYTTSVISSKANIPMDLPISVVVMSHKDSLYYYYQQTGITVTPDMTINAIMKKQSVSDLQDSLSLL